MIRNKLKAFYIYLKENLRFFLFLLFLFLVFALPLPYYIYTGGGIIPIDKRIEIENSKKEKGSFNLAYVTERKATPFLFLLAQFRKDFEIVKEETFKLNEEESEEEILFRDKIALEEANQTAVFYAYQKAGKKYTVKRKHFYVLYIDSKKKSPLKVGDDLLEVNGKEITSISMLQEEILKKEVGDSLPFLVQRGKKKLKMNVEVFLKDTTKMIGTSIREVDEIKTEPKISFHFKSAESGPSGGLMMTLAIYNRITQTDYTYGKKIVGTGTIEKDGSIGSIGGVLFKLRGAVSEKADVFLVPSGENYKDCLKEIQRKKYQIKLLPVDTFDDAVEKLKTLQNS